MTPELLPAKFGLSKEIPSKEADVYAFGMTVYQVLTGKWPFFPRRETEVMLAVVSDILKSFYGIPGERKSQSELVQCDWDVPSLECSHSTNQCGLTRGSLLAPYPSNPDIGGRPVTPTAGPAREFPGGETQGDCDYEDKKCRIAAGYLESVKHRCFPPWNYFKRIVRSMSW